MVTYLPPLLPIADGKVTNSKRLHQMTKTATCEAGYIQKAVMVLPKGAALQASSQMSKCPLQPF